MDTKVSLNYNLTHHKPQNELLFSEISPFWSERLNHARDNISPFSLARIRWYYELKNSSTCVVGEAYGFSSTYVSKCKKCNRLGWKFMFYFLIQSNSSIERTKIKFVDHWNKEHYEVKIRKKLNTNTNSRIQKPFSVSQSHGLAVTVKK
ncbi:MAG: hypothetical protein WAL66_08385 [Nitrososphaeraceae archaeon]